MKTFKDANNLEWTIAVNTTSCKRVKDLCDGFDLLSTDVEKVHLSLAEDPYLLVNVLYVLCKPQADQRKITDEQFGESLGNGDIVDVATAAMMEELVNFTRADRRPALTKAMEKAAAVQRAAMARAVARIDAIDVDKLIDEAFGKSSTTSPGS